MLNTKIGIQHTLTKHFDVDFYLGVNNITETHLAIKVFVNQLANPISKNTGDAYIPVLRKQMLIWD